MKKLLGLTIAFLLTVSLVMGGIFAYFTDVEAGSNNPLVAGTLDLSQSTNGTGPIGKYTVTPGGNGVNGNVVFQKLLPGDSGNIIWALTDNGTIPGNLVLSSNVTFSKGSSSEIKTAAGDSGGDVNGYLDEYMGVNLRRGVGADQAGATANLTYILGSSGSYAAFSNLKAALDSAGTDLAGTSGNDTAVYVLNWEINSLFGSVNPNIIQGDAAQIDITFTLN